MEDKDIISRLFFSCWERQEREDWELLRGMSGRIPDLRRLISDELDVRGDAFSPDGEKIWRNILSRIRIRERRLRVIRISFQYAAVALFSLLLAGAFHVVRESKQKYEFYSPVSVSVGLKPFCGAVLLLEDGSSVDLSAIGRDTVFDARNIRMRIDSLRSVCYGGSNVSSDVAVFHTLVVPRASDYELELSDGSRVRLNSASRLRFPVSFSGRERRVYLDGEAYFQVRSDTTKPFIVESGRMRLKVLGTEFNVCGYGTAGDVKATLVEGLVWVKDSLQKNYTVLLPGQQAEVADGVVRVNEVDVSTCISWLKGKFYFDRMSLEALSFRLESWYDVVFYFENERARSYLFTGVIYKSFSIEEITDLIAKTTRGVDFEIEGRRVIVR